MAELIGVQDDSLDEELRRQAEVMAIDSGLQQHVAADLARGLAEWLRQYRGGDRAYIRKSDPRAAAERDDRIRRDWNGRNRDEICKREGISRSRFYQIVGGPHVG